MDELLLILAIGLALERRQLFEHNLPFQLLMVLVIIILPFIILLAAIFFFAWLMGRKISQSVEELMLAVEKIRQQDLNFRISYRGNNELGDLCAASDLAQLSSATGISSNTQIRTPRSS